jgi:APA family basic amino acid/polyamine antiporter
MPYRRSSKLRRRLGLWLLVLYGTGITIGAGIYVLVGTVALHAKGHAPLAFLIAAVVMGLTVASYIELCARFPVAAGEAAYVKAAFGSQLLSRLTGGLMIATAVIASAAVTIGATGYISQFISAPKPIIIAAIIVGVGLIAAWGVLESVLLASLFTIFEVGGLVAIIVAAAQAGLPVQNALLTLPAWDASAWTGIAFASLLAFFAFIGFEDLTNMVEETHGPTKTMPTAIAITLVVTTVLYVLIAAIAVTAVSPERLAASEAPLTIIYEELAGFSPAMISAIAIGATLNTVIAEMTMATRVVYGMARMGDLPSSFGIVHGFTGTPLIATALISGLVLVLALFVPFDRLAEFTSLATLTVFALVNLALLALRLRDGKRRHDGIRVPLVIPAAGFFSCLVMIASALL